MMEQQEIIRFFDRCAPTWDAEMVRNEPVIAAILDNAGIVCGIDVLDVAHHVKRVHVGDEQELTTLCSVMSNRVVAQRLIHEFGTQVTAANTDSNDGREGLSRGSLQ